MLVPVAVGVSPTEPLVVCAPLQAPLAVHEVAFVEDQVKVELCPTVIVVGAALMLIVGGGDAAPPALNFATNAFSLPLFAGWKGPAVGKFCENV